LPKLFKTRAFAVAVTAGVIVFSLLAGTQKSLNALSAKTEAMFYSGVYRTEEGYTQPSINAQLKARADAALGLITLSGGGLDAAGRVSALRGAREALLAAQSIPEKRAANDAMQTAFDELVFWLSASSSQFPPEIPYTDVFYGAQAVIEQSDYNARVAEFPGVTQNFPVNILKHFIPVRYPEVF
jgi:hypothetical protein